MTEHLIFAGLLYVTFCLAYRKKGAGLVAGCIIGFALLVLAPAPPVVWGLYLAFAVIATVCWLRSIPARWFAALGCGIPIVAYAIAIANYYPRHRETMQLRAEYPPISITNRLSYESGKTPTPILTTSRVPGDETLPTPISGEVKRIEEQLSATSGRPGYLRWRSLGKLYRTHSDVVREFVESQGFGVTRGIPVPPPQHKYIDIPELPVVPYPDQSETAGVASTGDAVGAENELGNPPKNAHIFPPDTTLRAIHETSTVGYANPLGFGLVVDRDNVFGFQPHGFREVPTIPNYGVWQITRIELVSLLKHAQPGVYLSKNLPRMDELIDAPTRPLDSFETQSLEKLRAGEEIVVKRQRDELRMLGSLRAARQCTECHSVSRGDLLGAFTYRLRREGAARPQPAQQAEPVL